MKIKESLYSRNYHQSCFPLKLSIRILYFILIFVGLTSFSISVDYPCDPDVAFSPVAGYKVDVVHLTATSVSIRWTDPEVVRKLYPDYYCIVYNNKSEIALPPNKFSNRTLQYCITNLTPDIFYNINVKPCVNCNCSFMKSLTRRVHT